MNRREVIQGLAAAGFVAVAVAEVPAFADDAKPAATEVNVKQFHILHDADAVKKAGKEDERKASSALGGAANAAETSAEKVASTAAHTATSAATSQAAGAASHQVGGGVLGTVVGAAANSAAQSANSGEKSGFAKGEDKVKGWLKRSDPVLGVKNLLVGDIEAGLQNGGMVAVFLGAETDGSLQTGLKDKLTQTGAAGTVELLVVDSSKGDKDFPKEVAAAVRQLTGNDVPYVRIYIKGNAAVPTLDKPLGEVTVDNLKHALGVKDEPAPDPKAGSKDDKKDEHKTRRGKPHADAGHAALTADLA